MAPTICSVKKHLRVSNLKEARRRHGHAIVTSTAGASTATATATAATIVSNAAAAAEATQSNIVLSYVTKGSINAATATAAVARRLRGQRRTLRLMRRLPQISDNAVSSSTHVEEDYAMLEDNEAEQQQQLQQQQQLDALPAQAQTTNKEAILQCNGGSNLQPQQHNNSSSNSSNNSNNEDEDEDDQEDDNDNAVSRQLCVHSSSNNRLRGIQAAKTVLQPTMANNSNNNKLTTAKNCDVQSNSNNNSNSNSNSNNSNSNYTATDYDDDVGSGYDFSPAKCIEHQYKHNFHSQHHHHHHYNTEGLLSIAIKTINLVQRNRLLQKRLAQLQLETSEFISSVLANPENRHFREKINGNAVKAEGHSKVSNMLLRH